MSEQALEESILHWENIKSGKDFDFGVSGCELCFLYNGLECEGCPVHDETGEKACVGSPWYAFAGHALGHLQHGHKLDSGLVDSCEECQDYAQKMIDFLESLREGGENE